MNSKKSIGILDLQGGVIEHVHHLKALDIKVVRVKTPDQLKNLAGLIIPGGESTCLARLLAMFDFVEPLKKAVENGMKIWGTCAGAILIATKVDNNDGHLKLMEIEVQRNAFGSQLDSFHYEAHIPLVGSKPLELTFIRAPKIISFGKDVKPLLQIEDYIAAAEDENCLATVFHPELSTSLDFHKYFAKKCGIAFLETKNQKIERTSWMKYAKITQPPVLEKH